MSDVELRTDSDREALANYLRSDPALHLYELGDLDDLFWPHTEWWTLVRGDEIDAAALVYRGFEPPTVLAFDRREGGAHIAPLVQALTAELPSVVYTHLSPGAMPAFADWDCQWSAEMVKMQLDGDGALPSSADADVVELGRGDLDDIETLLRLAHPQHWLDERLLSTGGFVGIRERGLLVTVAGVHVLSERYRVAALGNIATHPEHRGRGLARRATGELCRRLRSRCDVIGLNVAMANEAARRCYRSLGFLDSAHYLEARLTRRKPR